MGMLPVILTRLLICLVIPPSTVQEIVDIPPNLQLEKPTVLGGKSNASEIVKNVISHTSTHIELSMTRKTGVMTFLIRGKPEDVKRARREVLSSFCIQVCHLNQSALLF